MTHSIFYYHPMHLFTISNLVGHVSFLFRFTDLVIFLLCRLFCTLLLSQMEILLLLFLETWWVSLRKLQQSPCLALINKFKKNVGIFTELCQNVFCCGCVCDCWAHTHANTHGHTEYMHAHAHTHTHTYTNIHKHKVFNRGRAFLWATAVCSFTPTKKHLPAGPWMWQVKAGLQVTLLCSFTVTSKQLPAGAMDEASESWPVHHHPATETGAVRAWLWKTIRKLLHHCGLATDFSCHGRVGPWILMSCQPLRVTSGL